MSDLLKRHWRAVEVRSEKGLSCEVGITAEVMGHITTLHARVQELEAALQDAIDSYEEYSAYAGEYLCKKHGVNEEIARLRAVLTPPKDSSDE